jgi:putative transposase
MAGRTTSLKRTEPPERLPVRWAFGETDRCYIRGIECIFVKYLAEGYVFARADNPKHTFPVSLTELDALDRAGRFKYERRGYDVQTSCAMLRSGERRFRDLPKATRDLINWKVKVIERFRELQRSGVASRHDGTAEKAIQIIKTEMSSPDGKRKRAGEVAGCQYVFPCPKWLIKWTKKFDASGGDKMSLHKNYANCGNHNPRYDADEFALLYVFVRKYLTKEKPKPAMLYRDMCTEFRKVNRKRRLKGMAELRIPGDDVLLNEIHNLDAFEVRAAHDGEEAAINYFRSVDNGPPGVLLPMQRVELDAWYVHLYTLAVYADLWDHLSDDMKKKVARERMLLTAAMDCATRVYLGMTLTRTVSGESTLKVLRMMFMDKTAIARAAGSLTPWEYRGWPDLVVFDGGPENANDDVTTGLDDLKIPYEIPKGGAPTTRGKIERGWHTTDQKLVSRFSGRTFKNPAVRKKYEAYARACVSTDEFAQILVRYFVDDYHNSPHSGLGGQPPRAYWLELSKARGVNPPPNRDELRLAFGEETTATLEAKGIRCMNNWYRSPEVQKLFERNDSVEVTIRYDTYDLGWISLKVGNEWLTVPGPKTMRGVSAETWMAAAADLKRRYRHLENLTRPIVDGAIGAAIDLDEKSRRRSGILDSPVTPEMLEQFHRNNDACVDYIDDSGADAAEPGDLFDGMLKVGDVPATPRRNAQKPSAPLKEFKKTVVSAPKRTKSGKPATSDPKPPAAGNTRAKPVRRWKIKERKP